MFLQNYMVTWDQDTACLKQSSSNLLCDHRDKRIVFSCMHCWLTYKSRFATQNNTKYNKKVTQTYRMLQEVMEVIPFSSAVYKQVMRHFQFIFDKWNNCKCVLYWTVLVLQRCILMHVSLHVLPKIKIAVTKAGRL